MILKKGLTRHAAAISGVWLTKAIGDQECDTADDGNWAEPDKGRLDAHKVIHALGTGEHVTGEVVAVIGEDGNRHWNTKRVNSSEYNSMIQLDQWGPHQGLQYEAVIH